MPRHPRNHENNERGHDPWTGRIFFGMVFRNFGVFANRVNGIFDEAWFNQGSKYRLPLASEKSSREILAIFSCNAQRSDPTSTLALSNHSVW